jgi:uncharacterized RDD family membrane protein YckC
MELYQEDRDLVPKRPSMWRGYALSSWRRRAVAILIDSLVLVVLWPIAGLAFGLDFGELTEDASGLLPSENELLSLAASTIAAFLYLPLIMRITDGATLGKLAARIRVVRTDGKPMSFTRAAWREVGAKTVLIGAIPLPFAIAAVPANFLWPLWDPQNRAIHDMLAGTRVVRSDIARVEQLAMSLDASETP